MAFFVFGGIHKCAQNTFRRGLYKVSKCENMQQVAFLSRAVDRVGRPPRPPPYPYQTKDYSMTIGMFDHLIERYDDNSKVIVVEGPPTAGKSKFAAHIAKEFDMLHVVKDPTVVHTDVTGRDLRYYTKVLPEQAQVLNLEDVVANPKHANAAAFEFLLYNVKFLEYARALVHVLLTGQGVVMESSVYSHFVYMDAMIRRKYVPRRARELYDFIENKSYLSILMPHVVIYLDLPVDEVQKRIAKRNRPYEVKSELITKDFLTDVDDGYKKFLKYISPHAYLLKVDVTKEPDMNDVCEQLEEADLDSFTVNDTMMHDWIWETEQDLKRFIVTLMKLRERYLIDHIPSTVHGIPELQCDAFTSYLLQCVRQEENPEEILKPGYVDKVHQRMEDLEIHWQPVKYLRDPFDLVSRSKMSEKTLLSQ